MTTLTDRYVHAVMRAIPGRQRAGLEPDVRVLVADAVDAHGGDERAAVTELGHPAVLASRYADGLQHLLGPGIFGEWQRILTLLLPIVVLLSSSVVFTLNLIEGSTVGQAITGALGVGVNAAIQAIFWVTVVFAVIERTMVAGTSLHGSTWTPDELPELPASGRMTVTDLASALIADTIMLVGIVWLQLQSPIAIEGVGYPLLDQALWSFWLPWFIVVLTIQVLLTIARFIRGRWTWASAVANATLNVAFAGPALYLLSTGTLFDPALSEAVTAATGDEWIRPTVTITAVVIAAIVAWDTLEGFLEARRAAAARP